MLGAGQGLGLCWQEAARPHSALRVPAWSHLPSGTAKWRWEIIPSMWAQLVLGNLSDYYPWWGSAATTGKPPFCQIPRPESWGSSWV